MRVPVAGKLRREKRKRLRIKKTPHSELGRALRGGERFARRSACCWCEERWCSVALVGYCIAGMGIDQV